MDACSESNLPMYLQHGVSALSSRSRGASPPRASGVAWWSFCSSAALRGGWAARPKTLFCSGETLQRGARAAAPCSSARGRATPSGGSKPRWKPRRRRVSSSLGERVSPEPSVGAQHQLGLGLGLALALALLSSCSVGLGGSGLRRWHARQRLS